MKKLIVVLALSAMYAVPVRAQSLWESGNAFLRACDERGPYRMSQSTPANLSWDTACLGWLVGVRQGMEVEDELRHERPALPPKAQKAQDEMNAAALADWAKLGVKPSAVVPIGNACIADEVTNEQIRLVVVNYMKDHADKLTTHAAMLAIAAMKTEWVCQSK